MNGPRSEFVHPTGTFSYSTEVASSIRDTRDRAGPSIGVFDDGRVATGVRASHSAGGAVTLLGDVSTLRSSRPERPAGAQATTSCRRAKCNSAGAPLTAGHGPRSSC